ncbi:Oligosaccharide translocation protein rft1 [Chamberlinius hualienensis]
MDGTKLLKTTAQAASYNIILQIVFRAQTFILNAFILRYISRDILGIINVRLFLLYSSILFLSKEAFRNATLSNTRHHDWPKVINLLWLTVPASVFCSFVFGYMWIYWLEMPEDPTTRYQYVNAVFIVCFCCILEMTGEPLYIVARIHTFNKLRVVLESLSVSLRCFALAVTVYFIPEVAIYGYAAGQVACSSIWVAGIYIYFGMYFKNDKNKDDNFPFKTVTDFFPKYLTRQEKFSPDQLLLTWSFFKQGFLKQILTEGERYLMTLLGVLSFAEQGIYDVINNLGSLAARFILRPIEDSSYQFFAGLVNRDQHLNKQNKDEMQLVSNVLWNLLRFMILFGLIAISFGYAYSKLLLHIYGGQLLSSGTGPVLLRWHCVYILFLSVNGITECFAFATMSKENVEKYNFLMVGFSVGFIFLSWYLTTVYGSVGFLLANCANMFARIIYSTSFIYSNFKNEAENPLSGLIPDKAVGLTLLLSFIITTTSEGFYGEFTSFFDAVCHVSVGAVCCLVTLAVIFLREKRLIQFVKTLILRKKLD